MSKSDIKDIENMEFDELLGKVDVGEPDVVESHINERQDMSKELLGCRLNSRGLYCTLSRSRKAPHDGRCGELHLGMDSCLGVLSFSFPLNCYVKIGFNLCKNNEEGLNEHSSTCSLRHPITPMYKTSIHCNPNCMYSGFLIIRTLIIRIQTFGRRLTSPCFSAAAGKRRGQCSFASGESKAAV